MQCDQMARLLVQYLTIYNIENWPNSISFSPKGVPNFAKYYQNNALNCHILSKPAKVAKFCQIWSHSRSCHRQLSPLTCGTTTLRSRHLQLWAITHSLTDSGINEKGYNGIHEDSPRARLRRHEILLQISHVTQFNSLQLRLTGKKFYRQGSQP